MRSARALVYDAPVRIALISPYSYSYPGGVGWHVEALAEELIRHGHDVRLLAPYDPDDRLASLGHRGDERAGPGLGGHPRHDRRVELVHVDDVVAAVLELA